MWQSEMHVQLVMRKAVFAARSMASVNVHPPCLLLPTFPDAHMARTRSISYRHIYGVFVRGRFFSNKLCFRVLSARWRQKTARAWPAGVRDPKWLIGLAPDAATALEKASWALSWAS